MTGEKMRRQRSVETVPCSGIGLQLQRVSIGLDRGAPTGAAFGWRPVIGIADQDQGVGLKRADVRVPHVATGIKSHGRRESSFARTADKAAEHRLQYRPATVREADHAHPLYAELGSGAQIRGTVESIARLRPGRHQEAVVAHFGEPARPEAVDQQRRIAPCHEALNP